MNSINAFYAFSLALNGDTIIVGAPYLDISDQAIQGRFISTNVTRMVKTPQTLCL